MSTAYKTTVEDEILEMNDGKKMVDAQTQTLGTDDGAVKDVKRYDRRSISSLSGSDTEHGVKPMQPEALHLAEETINKGGIFAKNAKDKYRATNPALGKSTVINDVASSIEKAFKQGYSMRDASIIPDEAPKTVSGNNQNLIEPSDVIGFTAAAESEVVPGRAVTAPTISHSPKGKNREQMDYFGSWGPQIKRDTPAAQQRKVVFIGDPEWLASPKPAFIVSLTFGGPLEDIRCMANSAEVTFIKPDDALKFYQSTANGIVYSADTKTIYCAETYMPIDPTPTSSYVRDCYNLGATRSIRAIGVDPAIPLDSLRVLAEGKASVRGVPSRKLERLEDSMNANGYRVVIFHFCDIRNAITFKGKFMRRWESVNFQFITDPCAVATAPRLQVRPITQVF